MSATGDRVIECELRVRLAQVDYIEAQENLDKALTDLVQARYLHRSAVEVEPDGRSVAERQNDRDQSRVEAVDSLRGGIVL